MRRPSRSDFNAAIGAVAGCSEHSCTVLKATRMLCSPAQTALQLSTAMLSSQPGAAAAEFSQAIHTLTKEDLPSASSLSQCCSSAALFRLSRVEPGSEGTPEWCEPAVLLPAASSCNGSLAALQAAVSLEAERGITLGVCAAQDNLPCSAQVTYAHLQHSIHSQQSDLFIVWAGLRTCHLSTSQQLAGVNCFA